MNHKQLQAFLAFMVTGSTIEAAQRLGASQPSISRLLSQFEADLGVSLFTRRKGRLYPTREAEILLPDVQNMISNAESLHRHVNQIRLGGFRHMLVRVHVPNTVAQSVMPDVARQFLHDHPRVALEVLSGSYESGEVGVLGREVDLALIRYPSLNDGLDLMTRLSTEAVCIFPPGHALAALNEITPADLIGVDLVLLGRQRSLRHQIDQTFRQARMLPQIRAEVHSVETACRFVAQGIGVSIVNGLFAHLCRDLDIQCRPFRPKIDYFLGMATLAGQRPHTLAPVLTERILAALTERAGPTAFSIVPAAASHGAKPL